MKWVISWLVALQLPAGAPAANADEDHDDHQQRREAIETMNRGVEEFDQGQLILAGETLKAAIVIDPDYPQAHVNMARLHIALYHYLDAEKELEHALELVGSSDPTLRAAIHYDLGRIHLVRAQDLQISKLERDDYARRATQSFAAAAEGAPGDYQAHHQRGLAYDLLDDAHEADRSFRACIDIQPKYAPCYADLARVYFDFGAPQLAEAVIEAGLGVDDTSAELWLASAKLHLNLERLQQAVDAGNKAKAIDPDLVEVHFVLGIGYGKLQLRKQARESLGIYLAKQIGEPPGRVRAANDMLVWAEFAD